MGRTVDDKIEANVDYYVAAAKAYNYDILSSMPKQLRNSSTYMQIVEANPRIIAAIPKKYRSSKLCQAAAKGMGYASIDEWIEHDPESFTLLPRTVYSERSCYAFLSSSYAKREYTTGNHLHGLYYDNNRAGISLSYIELADILKWKSVCEVAVKLNFSMIGAVPEQFLSHDLCEMAVRASYMALEYIPESYRDETICKLALDQCGYSIEYVPNRSCTYEMAQIGIKASGGNLCYVPEHLRTAELCLAAVSNDYRAFEFIPKNIITREMCELAVNQSGISNSNLKDVPKEFIDHVLCLMAVRNNGYNLQYVPIEYRDSEISLAAVKKDGGALQYVLPDVVSEEICVAAIRDQAVAVKFVPKKLMTPHVLAVINEKLEDSHYRVREAVLKMRDQILKGE